MTSDSVKEDDVSICSLTTDPPSQPELGELSDYTPTASTFTVVTSTEETISLQTPNYYGNRRCLGLFFALAAAFTYSVSALVVKVISYPPFKLGLWRFLLMAVITCPFLIHGHVSRRQSKEGVLRHVWPPNKLTALVILQAGLSANFILSSFFGINYLEIGDTIVISTSAPVFVTLVARLTLQERCGVLPVVMGLLSLFGVAIICKPPIFTGAATLNPETAIGVTFSFGGMCLLTFCYVVVRYLRKVHYSVIQMTFAIWGVLECLVGAYTLDVLETPEGWREVGLVCLSALLAFTAQTCLTLALKFEEAGVVAMVRTLEVIFCYLWQTIFFHHQPDIYSMIGAAILVACVLLAALRNVVASLPEGHQYKQRLRFVLI